MRLVPRQLRRSDFPSSVPYYGGRLTPQVIEGMKTYAVQHPSPPPPAAGPSAAPAPPVAPVPPADPALQLERLEELRDQGYVTAGEYEEIRRRIVGGT